MSLEFTQVHNINLSEIAQFVKAVIKTSRYHSLGINPLCGQWRLSVKVSSEWRLNLGLGTQKRCPLALNRGISSLKVTDTKTMWAFFPGPNFVSTEWRCPLNRGVPKERLRMPLLWNCKIFFFFFFWGGGGAHPVAKPSYVMRVVATCH